DALSPVVRSGQPPFRVPAASRPGLLDDLGCSQGRYNCPQERSGTPAWGTAPPTVAAMTGLSRWLARPLVVPPDPRAPLRGLCGPGPGPGGIRGRWVPPPQSAPSGHPPARSPAAPLRDPLHPSGTSPGYYGSSPDRGGTPVPGGAPPEDGGAAQATVGAP